MADLSKAAQGAFDELLAGVEPDLAAIAQRLRAKSTVETVRLGDNARESRTAAGRHRQGATTVKIRSMSEANRHAVRSLVAAALSR